jgi:hypothetical protein
MYVLFVCRLTKRFYIREAKGPGAYEPPPGDHVVAVDDSIHGWLDALAVVRRIAQEEGWRNFTIFNEDA